MSARNDNGQTPLHEATVTILDVFLCLFLQLTFLFCFFFFLELANLLKVVRFLLLNGANPLDADNFGNTSLYRAKAVKSLSNVAEERVAFAETVCQEMESLLANPIRYRSDCSALIQLSIGLASLDLPVLLVTIIAECLASINEEKLIGRYSEHKSWDIVALIKKKANMNNNNNKNKKKLKIKIKKKSRNKKINKNLETKLCLEVESRLFDFLSKNVRSPRVSHLMKKKE